MLVLEISAGYHSAVCQIRDGRDLAGRHIYVDSVTESVLSYVPGSGIDSGDHCELIG